MRSGEEGSAVQRCLPFILVAVILSFGLGIVAANRFGGDRPGVSTSGMDSRSAQSAAASDELYVCPMMDVPPMRRPGRCPVCGMDLVRVSGAEDNGSGANSVMKLAARTARLAGIQTAPVQRKAVTKEVRLYGKIEYDPAHLSVVSAYMPGVIDRIYVERAGVSVKWGQPLFDFYSSDLYFTERELFEAAQTAPGLLAFRGAAPHTARKGDVETRGADPANSMTSEAYYAALQKMNAIRHKLQILGLSKKDLDELQQRSEPTGIATVTAPRAGVVIQKNAFEGTFVNTGTPLFTIADPKYIWLKLDAYEEDLGWLRVGQDVDFWVEAYPGERFRGKVIFVDPIFDAQTRTIKVGVIAPDDVRLRPEMIARATIHAALGAGGHVGGGTAETGLPPLVIPVTAPLITGKRVIVYVALPDEDWTYQGREVQLGPRAGDTYVVRGGLEEGERVVVNGNFKIDSAAQILARPSMMQPKGQ